MGYQIDATRKSLVTPARDTSFFPAGRPAVESALAAELSRLAYAAFERDPGARAEVASTLQRVGFTACTCFSGASTQGYLAHDPAASLSALVFRGTELDPRDWATDLDALLVPWRGGGRVHQGFAGALALAWDEIAPALATVRGRLIFAGHSLGGALATLATSLRPPDALYTFGSPRVGDAAFAAAASSTNHRRYTNCCDIVTRLPPEAMSYRHTGVRAYLDHHGRLHVDPSQPVIDADRRQARRGYLLRWSWRRGTMWTRDAADHAAVNYVSAIGFAERTLG